MHTEENLPEAGEIEGATSTASEAAEPAIEFGTDLSGWRDLADGGSLELVAGFQDGWHVDVSVRGEGLAPDDIALRNISGEPVAAGGLLIGDEFGVAGEINPGDVPHGLADDPEHLHAQRVASPRRARGADRRPRGAPRHRPGPQRGRE